MVVFKNGAVCPLSRAISDSSNSFKATLTEDLLIENCWILTIEDTPCVAIVACEGQVSVSF